MEGHRSAVVAVIPVRLDSSRLPGKALVDICGLPMIVHVLLRCRYAELLDDQLMVIARAIIARINFETNKSVPDSTSNIFVQRKKITISNTF